MKHAVVTVNTGSSSIKFALHPLGEDGRALPAELSGQLSGLEDHGTLDVALQRRGHATPQRLALQHSDGYAGMLEAAARYVRSQADGWQFAAIAHRVVHGGERYRNAVRLDAAALAYLETIAPLAPLHQPHNLEGVRAFQRVFDDLPHVACFDTAFHASLDELEYRFALPAELSRQGVRRYGFHGLSYQYVSQALKRLSPRGMDRVVIAHLGNGSSLAALHHGVSRATSMGFSALDGLIMGTRCGALDAGVLLYLLARGWDAARLETLLYRQSGLLGVSELSADMRTLRASHDPRAALAIALYTRRLLREIGALTAVLQGLDALVFTAGIGEHDAQLRADVCEALGYLGVRLDAYANRTAAEGEPGARALHASDSRVEVWVIPTDEGIVAAQQAWDCVQSD